MRMAAHSCLTALKSLGGARTTVATAALNASFREGESEPSDAAILRRPLNPFQVLRSPDGLLHNFHFLPLVCPDFSYPKKRKENKIKHFELS